MPITDHTGRELPPESGARHESRHTVSSRDLAVVLNANVIAHPVDVSAFGLAVLVPPDCGITRNEVAVRLIFGESMRMAQGSMKIAGAEVNQDGTALRVGLTITTPGPLADLLKDIVTSLERNEAA